jgi:hypothetical protein
VTALITNVPVPFWLSPPVPETMLLNVTVSERLTAMTP